MMLHLPGLMQPKTAAACRAPPLVLRVRAEQTRILYRCMPFALAASAVCATLLSVMLRHDLAPAPVVIWLSAAYASCALCVLLWGLFGYARPGEAERPAWGRLMVLAAGLNGAILGLGGLLLHIPGHSGEQLPAVLVMLSLTLAGLLMANACARAFRVFVAPALSLSVVPFLAGGDANSVLIGAAALAALTVLCALTQASARRQERAIATRLRVRRLTGRLRAQKRAAEQACQTEARFLAHASHELLQPLHALDLFAKALGEKPLAAEARELVAGMRHCITSLDELFVLHISLLDAGAFSVPVGSFPLETLFSRLRPELAVLAQEKQLRWQIAKTAVWVHSNPGMLLQILRNFMGNAIRYTPQGGRLLIGCRREAQGVRIEVRDNGVGIAAEDHARIFEESVQLDNPERDSRKGTGLGLPIAARFARFLSHPLSVRPSRGRGAVFAVSVPRGAHEQPLPQEPAPHTGLPGAADLPGLTVLVLDDDGPAREGIEQQLERWGCPVAGADSAAQAISRLQDLGRSPDLILTAQHLHAQAQQVSAQQHSGQAQAPVLLVMAESLDACRDCEESGVAAVAKPVNPAWLRSFLMHIALERGAAARLRS